MLCEKLSNLRFDGLGQRRTRSAAQDLCEGIGKGPWLGELDDVSVEHGVSLLHWRSGGVEHHHDTPPYPVTPSPTSGHSSIRTGNPYKELVGDLMKRGVKIELCGATAKAHNWGNDDLLPGIKVNTDAMARTTQLVQEGFVKITE